jgi:hypothetical protein
MCYNTTTQVDLLVDIRKRVNLSLLVSFLELATKQLQILTITKNTLKI